MCIDLKKFTSKTVLPTLIGRINPGRHVLCCAVLGAVGEDVNFDVNKNPSISFEGSYAMINIYSKEIRINTK